MSDLSGDWSAMSGQTEEQVIGWVRGAVGFLFGDPDLGFRAPEYAPCMALLDRLPALLAAEAECGRLTESRDWWKVAAEKWAAKANRRKALMDALQQRVAELEQDAARWRWLVDYGVECILPGLGRDTASIDEATIDAARAATTEEGGAK